MKRTKQVGGALVALMIACQASAQGLCTLEDSQASCLVKYQAQADKLKDEAKKESQAQAGDELAAKTTGIAQAVAGNLASSFSDFFSTFKAAADTDTGGDDDDDAVGFEFSRCMREQTESSRVQCQARVRIGGAKLYEPLKQALPEATRDERAGELEKGLELGDSVTAGVFFNYVSRRFGRVPRFADGELFGDMWKSVDRSTEASTQVANAATQDFEVVVEKVLREDGLELTDAMPFSEISKKSPAHAKEALAAKEAELRSEFASMADMRKRLFTSHYFDVVDLVNNQPQLSFGVEYSQRGELAGPDEWRAKFIWEMGFVNVNSASDFVYVKGCGEKPAADEDAKVDRAIKCLHAYLSDAKTQKRLKNGDRVALSVEFVQRKKYSVVLADDVIDFDQDADKSLIAALTYGYYISFDDMDEPTSRLDIKGSYEDVSSDPTRQDRGVLAATFSQRVFGSTVLAVSLVYGTKAEFRGDVDKELGAHLGFNYKWGKATSF